MTKIDEARTQWYTVAMRWYDQMDGAKKREMFGRLVEMASEHRSLEELREATAEIEQKIAKE